MYETFYGLQKRPYSAAADPRATVATPAVADVIERLDRCVRQGRGIGVLTGSSGLGKTHLCHRLAQMWQSEFQVTILPNAGFPTGRGLLQAIFADLDQPYQGLRETELRIELTSVVRAVREQSSGLVLILDEAHRASERLLEEVRLIANLIEAGEPLVRILLVGKLELEDKLADPDLAGLNERVGELVTLPRLTAEEARHYLDERAKYAGGDLDELFEDAAVDLIVQACGGVPRCLNQLADHGLLLGSVAERKPVDSLLMREALDDLKRLPLQWQDPLPARFTVGDEHADAAEPPLDGFSRAGENIIEIGGLADDEFDGSFAADSQDEPGGGASGATVSSDGFEWPTPGEDATAGTGAAFLADDDSPDPPASEPILDRFAQLDACEAKRRWLEELERSERGESRRSGATQTAETRRSATERVSSDGPLAVIQSLESVIAEELDADEAAAVPAEPESPCDAGRRSSLDQIVSALQPTAEQVSPRSNESPAVSSRQESSPQAGSCTTLFRDLRRRDQAAGE